MKLDEVINGYRIVTAPTNSGGGRCVWAFATKGSDRWFVKRFLNPKFPVDGSPGSAAGKHIRRENCERFEGRHLTIMSRLNPEAPGGGNLVTATDFFRYGATYYKVTVPITPTTPPKLHRLEPIRSAVILRTMVLSLRVLHDANIVHGDLKTSNMLFQAPASGASGFTTTKLIDFDDSYFAGSPPPIDEMSGDDAYLSPELRRYLDPERGCRPDEMALPSDIFSLGIVFHELFTGAFPSVATSAYASVADAVIDGKRPAITNSFRPEMTQLLNAMLELNPGNRPSVANILDTLRDESICAKVSGPRLPRPSAATNAEEHASESVRPVWRSPVRPARPVDARADAPPPPTATKRTPAPAAPEVSRVRTRLGSRMAGSKGEEVAKPSAGLDAAGEPHLGSGGGESEAPDEPVSRVRIRMKRNRDEA